VERHSKERVIPIEIYTDGSLKKLGRFTTFGGWAFIALQDNRILYEAANGESNTTNQRMELQAILEGLKYAYSVRRPMEKVILYSDSAYAINCYNQEWYTKWIANGWYNSQGQPVANQDLWEQIIPFFDNFWYTFRKVPGHAGCLWNEKCDELAQNAALQQKKLYRGKKNEQQGNL